MKAFDVHCHLYDSAFDKDRAEVIKRAKQILFGVLVAGEDPETNRKTLALAAQYPKFCFASLGFHPSEIHKFEDKEIEKEVRWVKEQKPIAISEIGLDYATLKRENLDEFAKMRQIHWFETFLQLADELKIPAIVHSRWATKVAIGIIADLKIKKVILHAFSGTEKEVQRALELGCKFSIGNTIAFAKQKQDLARILPLDAMLLETDSPVAGPNPGERNEPANISLTIKALAKLKKTSEEDIVKQTNKNVKKLFKL